MACRTWRHAGWFRFWSSSVNLSPPCRVNLYIGARSKASVTLAPRRTQAPTGARPLSTLFAVPFHDDLSPSGDDRRDTAVAAGGEQAARSFHAAADMEPQMSADER